MNKIFYAIKGNNIVRYCMIHSVYILALHNWMYMLLRQMFLSSWKPCVLMSWVSSAAGDCCVGCQDNNPRHLLCFQAVGKIFLPPRLSMMIASFWKLLGTGLLVGSSSWQHTSFCCLTSSESCNASTIQRPAVAASITQLGSLPLQWIVILATIWSFRTLLITWRPLLYGHPRLLWSW